MNNNTPISDKIRTTMQACAAVEVKLPTGDISIGTAFHVGDGVYLTARHVVEGNTVLNVLPNTDGYLLKEEAPHASDGSHYKIRFGDKEIEACNLHHDSPVMIGKPKYHSDNHIDVAAFQLKGIDPNTPALTLGGHYDDWIINSQWLLTKAIVFGYPRIPTSKNATLVVDEVTVNAVIDTYWDRYVRFVVSGVPRGGFSGGPAWHEWNCVLGMITESLEYQGDDSCNGYLTVLSIEALRECLEQHDLLPDSQKIDI